MPQSPRFWNRIAKKYARSPIADEESYEEKLRRTREILRPDMAMLEIGCGTGSTALLHAPLVKTVTALDFSPAMIDIAKGKAEDAGIRNVTFEVGDAESLEGSEGSYDVALAMSLLHLLEEPSEVLVRLRRLLKPGGYLVSSTVCLGDTRGLVKHLLPLGHALRLLPLVRSLKSAELEQQITDAGFTIDQVWRPTPDKAVFIIARARSADT